MCEGKSESPKERESRVPDFEEERLQSTAKDQQWFSTRENPMDGTYAFLLLLCLGLQSNPDIDLSPSFFLLSPGLRQIQLQFQRSDQTQNCVPVNKREETVTIYAM